MNCQDIAHLLDNEIRLANEQQNAAVRAHLHRCESCQSAWRAARLLRLSAHLPDAQPRASLFAESMQFAMSGSAHSKPGSASFWIGGILGAALAASLAVFAVLVIEPVTPFHTNPATPTLTIALQETRAISFGIESVEPLENARIRLALHGGVELRGGGGRREISWTTNLSAGVNRLTLPITAVSDEPGTLLVELVHGAIRQRFELNVNTTTVNQTPMAIIG